MKSYLNVLQEKTARWYPANNPEMGLYTDGITTCRIFILVGKKDNKTLVSLTHLSQCIFAQRIIDESKNFDSISGAYYCRKDIECKTKALQEYKSIFDEQLIILNDSGLNFEIYPIPNEHETLTMNRNAQTHDLSIETHERNFYENITLINWPDADIRFSMYMLNGYCSTVEGDISFQEKMHITQEIKPDDCIRFLYQNTSHNMQYLLEKFFFPPVDHQWVIFDGYSFQEPKSADTTLTDTARKYLENLGKFIIENEIILDNDYIISSEFILDLLQELAADIRDIEKNRYTNNPVIPRDWENVFFVKIMVYYYTYCFTNRRLLISDADNLVEQFLLRYKSDPSVTSLTSTIECKANHQIRFAGLFDRSRTVQLENTENTSIRMTPP